MFGCGQSLKAQNRAAEIHIVALRRAGELLDGMDMHGGNRHSASRLHDATLKDRGIAKTQSHRWQTMVTVPEPQFREYVAKIKVT